MISKILVSTNAADVPDATLRFAAELATSNNAELVVLEVEPLIDARQVFDPSGAPGRLSPVRRLQGEYPALRVRANAARGRPLQAVFDVADDERPDVIVVGRGHRRHTPGLLSRRASNALVERAPCPVLLVAS